MAEEATNTAPAPDAPAPDGGQPAPPAPEPQSQELLAGKYRSVDDLVKGYKELESRLGRSPEAQGSTPEPAGDQPEGQPDPAPEPPPPPQSVDDVLERAGLQQSDLVSEWNTNGRLSDQQYESLAKQGYPRDVVDSFYRGQQAQLDTITRQAQTIAGGEQALENMLSWAGKALDEQSQNDLDARLQNPRTAIEAVQALKQQYDAAIRATGSRPLLGGGTPPPAPVGFTDPAEYRQFIRDVTKNGRTPTPAELERIRATPRQVTMGRRINR